MRQSKLFIYQSCDVSVLGFVICLDAQLSKYERGGGSEGGGSTGAFGRGGGGGGTGGGGGGGGGGSGGGEGGGGGEGPESGGSLEESIPGIPGEDYPIYATVPDTGFSCDGQVHMKEFTQ